MNEDEIAGAWADSETDRGEHQVAAFIEDGGVYLEFTCTSKPTAWCRQHCSAESCENFPCSHAPRQGECNVILFLSEDGLSLYEGPRRPLVSGDITYNWAGADETYLWSYKGGTV